jgi:hypothetical protein
MTKTQLTGASIVTAFLMAVASPIILCTAAATEKYAAETGVPCSQCHQYPTGDARLTPFGKAFVANGFKLPATEPKPPMRESKPSPSDTTPSK